MLLRTNKLSGGFTADQAETRGSGSEAEKSWEQLKHLCDMYMCVCVCVLHVCYMFLWDPLRVCEFRTTFEAQAFVPLDHGERLVSRFQRMKSILDSEPFKDL